MNSRRVIRVVGAVLGAAIVSAAASAMAIAQTNPQVGTWVLNLEKSKFSPGPAPKSQSVVYSAVGSGLKIVVSATDAAGKPATTEFTTTFDGKESPTRGNPDYDSVTAKRVDDQTIELTLKRAGKPVQTVTRAVAKDGQSATVTVTGVNVKGQKINNVMVYTRK